MNHREIVEAIQFSAEQVDQKPCPWADGYERPHWKLYLAYDHRRVSFDFWNNAVNREPERWDILSMLLSDATAGLMGIDEFAEEFGYMMKPSVAIRTHKGCQKATMKFKALLKCEDDDLYDFANAVSELECEEAQQ